MSQWDYKIDQPMPGPFPFPNSRKGPGIEVDLNASSGVVLRPLIFQIEFCKKLLNSYKTSTTVVSSFEVVYYFPHHIVNLKFIPECRKCLFGDPSKPD